MRVLGKLSKGKPWTSEMRHMLAQLRILVRVRKVTVPEAHEIWKHAYDADNWDLVYWLNSIRKE